jgi:hypothetical protein
LRLERTRYEAERARRRCLAVEPEHRLVARSLERDWNEKLAELEGLEREHAARPASVSRAVEVKEREHLLALAQDLPRLWQAETTTATERKQLLRCLIKDVTLTKQAKTVRIDIGWQTEASTRLEVARSPRAHEARPSSSGCGHSPRTLPMRLSPRRSMQRVSSPARVGALPPVKVHWARYAYRIPSGCPQAPGVCQGGQRADGRHSVQSAARVRCLSSQLSHPGFTTSSARTAPPQS